MSVSETRLDPCPFCGSTKIALDRHRAHAEPDSFSIRCHDCGAHGPYAHTYFRDKLTDETAPMAAVERWNKRAT